MIKPKEIEITTSDGVVKRFVISRVPASVGREIAFKYLPSGTPKVGDYATNEEMAYKLLSYVSVVMDSGELRLSNKALVDNHCEDWETQIKLEKEMLTYNFSFFRDGKVSGFLDLIVREASKSSTEMLTTFLPRLLQAVKQASKS